MTLACNSVKQKTILERIVLGLGGRAGMAPLWEQSPPTNVARARFLDPAIYVGWVEFVGTVFSPGIPVSPLLKN